MAAPNWPITQMAEALGGVVVKGEGEAYTIRLANAELGIKLKLDIATDRHEIRLVVDRLSKRRPTFVASLVLDAVVSVKVNARAREVELVLADGRRLRISAQGTLRLYRPA